MEKTEPVFLDSDCLRTMITSALEVYNRETNGMLIGRMSVRSTGRKRERIMSVKDTYSYQTDDRKPTTVEHGNISAFRRVLGSLNTMNMRIVGGYHSHNFPYNVSRLSPDDLLFAEEEMNEINKRRINDMNRWLEVLLSVAKNVYRRPHRTGWHARRYRNKVRFIVVTKPFEGYDIFVSAYWINFIKGRPRVREARVLTGLGVSKARTPKNKRKRGQ